MTMPLEAALAQLDPANDTHWTAEGLPAMAVLADLVGGPVKREDVKAVAPDLTRETAASPTAAPETTKGGDDDAQGQEVSTYQPGDEEEVIDDEALLEMTITDLGGDLDAMDEYLAASDRFLAEMHRTMEDIKAKLELQSRRADIVTRVRDKLRKANPNASGQAIRDYLKRQKVARAEKAERAQAFIAAGTTARDVADQLRIKSPIDAAMAQRKPAPGSTRPALGMPVRK